MVTELKKKEIQTVKEMVDLFTAKISDFKNDMDNIDEKYRKIIEEEKSELKKNLADCKSQLKVWKKMFDSFDTTLVAEAVGEYVSTSTEDMPDFSEPAASEEVEEKIVDTIFSDNNVEEDEEPEFDEAGDTEADRTEDTESDNEENEDDSEAEVSEKSEEQEIEVDEDGTVDDDGWPEFPEEWK